MVIHTCPNCGKDLTYQVLTTDPPIHSWSCVCGFRRTKRESVERVPLTDKQGR